MIYYKIYDKINRIENGIKALLYVFVTTIHKQIESSKELQERITHMAYTRRNEKNGWALFLLILAGIVIGGLIGELASNVVFLEWLNFGYGFKFANPISLDLKVITVMFQLTMDITISSIIGVAIAIFVYKKI